MKHYYELTKTGLVMGNIITVLAGYFLGVRVWGVGAASVSAAGLAAVIAGMYLVMASGCVFNNCFDRDIDATMERTKHRVLVRRKVSLRAALSFGMVLGVAGFAVLYVFDGPLTAFVAGLGFFFYVVAYTLWAKRGTVYGTFIGAIAGAIPPVVGYAAAAVRIDMAAVILFLIMLAWQMPHFFAIAIRRADEYAAAKVPVMPLSRGMRRTKISMLIYIAEFTAAAALLSFFGYAGYVYLAIALFLGASWFAYTASGLRLPDTEHGAAANRRWAREVFLYSLVVMTVLFATIGIGALV